MSSVATIPNKQKEDWTKIGSGLPATLGVKDPEIRRFLEAVLQNIRYVLLKVQDIREPPLDLPEEDVAKKPAVLLLPKPTVTISRATSITSSGAVLNGTVNPNGYACTSFFEYGTTVSYGSTTTVNNDGYGTIAAARTATLSGLSSETTYHARIQATNTNGTSYSKDITFRTKPDGYPPDFPDIPQDDDPSEIPGDDPSDIPTDNSCDVSIAHSSYPETLTFTMKKGTPPDSQNWFWQVRGWWTSTLTGTYVTSAAWYNRFEATYMMWFVAKCDVVFVRTVRVEITGKDAAGAWLDAGTYEHNEGIAFTDGEASACAITLIVTGGAVMVINSPITLKITSDGFVLSWEAITIQNTTAGETLNWTNAITSDPSGVLQLSSAAGQIVGVGSEDIVVSLASTPAVGSYASVVRFSGDGDPASTDVDVNLTVSLAVPNTNFVWHYYKTTGAPTWTRGASGWAKWVPASSYYRYNASGVNDTIIYQTGYTRVKASGTFYNFNVSYTQDGSGNLIGNTGEFVVGSQTFIVMVSPTRTYPP